MQIAYKQTYSGQRCGRVAFKPLLDAQNQVRRVSLAMPNDFEFSLSPILLSILPLYYVTHAQENVIFVSTMCVFALGLSPPRLNRFSEWKT